MTIKQQGGVFGRNPSFNDVEANDLTVTGPTSLDGAVVINESGADVDFRVESDTSTHAIFVDAGNNRVGINNPSPFNTLDVAGSLRADAFYMLDNEAIFLGTGSPFKIYNDGSTSIIRSQGEPLSINANGITFTGYSPYTTLMTIAQDGNVSIPVGNLSFASGKGIDFSATSGTGTSELFDDYEEGTWTPNIIGSSSAGTATYNARYGRYTKIGDVVHVYGFYSISGHTGAGNIRIDGLPYTPSSSDSNLFPIGTINTNNLTLTAGAIQLGTYASPGQTYLTMTQLMDGAGSALVPMDTAHAAYFSTTYFA